MSPEVVAAFIGAASAIVVGIPAALITARATLKGAVRQAVLEIDGAHALERHAAQRAACTEVAEASQTCIDTISEALQNVEDYHSTAVTASPPTPGGPPEPPTMPEQPFTDLRRAITRLLLTGCPDVLLLAAGNLHEDVLNAAALVRTLREHVILRHSRGGGYQDDGTLAFVPAVNGATGLVLPNDREQQQALVALSRAGVALSDFVTAVSKYASGSVLPPPPAGRR